MNRRWKNLQQRVRTRRRATPLVATLACLGWAAAAWGAPGDVLFSDDFERAALGADWTVDASGGGDAGIGTHTANSGTRSLYTRWDTVRVSSRAVDLSGVSAAQLSLWVRRGSDSFSEWPEGNGEDFQVQYLDSTGGWVTLAEYPTGSPAGEVFTPTFDLPVDALHAGFRVRFVQSGGNGSGGCSNSSGWSDCDYWHVDDVVVTESTANPVVGGFCDDFEGGLGRWRVYSAGGDAGINDDTASSPSNSLFLRWGEVTVTSDLADLSAVSSGSIAYWVRRGDGDFSEDPDSGEDLVVEYYTSSGTWQALDTFSGSGSGGAIFSRSHALPADARHAQFMLRFRMIDGSGADYDYWHVDDVCLGPAGFPQPDALAYYAMDDASWDGTAGEVTDASGNGHDGRALGAANTVDPGKVCYGGDIPRNTSSGQFDAVDTGIDVDDDIGDRGTIDFWYKSDRDWRGGGDRMLLDASTTTDDKYFYLMLGDDGRLTFGLEDTSDRDIRFESSRFDFGAGEWVHIAITWDMDSDRREIYVNGSVDRTDNRNSSGRLGELGTLYLGDNRSSYHPDGTGNSANGVLDEVRIYDVVLTQAQVQVDMNATHPCGPTVDHFRILHDGTALTCQADAVTVQACADAACSQLVTDHVDVTLSPSGWVGGDAKGFDGGSGVFELRRTTPGPATLGIASAAPPPANPTRCFLGGVEGDCTLTFHESGFLFDVPNQVACLDSAAVTIAAVRADDSGQKCVPAFANTSKEVRFWSGYVSPAAPVNPQPLVVNGTSVAGASPGTSVNLAFDGNGEAQLTVRYDEAGQLQLDARHEGTGDEAGLVMSGSDQFVVRPDRFFLRATTDGSTDLNNSGANGDPKWQAGVDFRAQVRAACADGTQTRNYQPGNAEAFVEMINPPEAPGVQAGVLTLRGSPVPGSFASAPVWQGIGPLFSEGAIVAAGQSPSDPASYADARFSEVGVVDLHVRDSNYLGVTIPESVLTVGRFIPARFAVSDNGPGFRDATAPWSCGFSYFGQPFGYATEPELTVRALNAQGAVTANYAGAFWKLAGNPLDSRSYADASGAGLTVAPQAVGTTSVVGPTAGEARYGLSGETISYERTERPPLDAQVDLAVTAAALTDSDGVCYDPGGVPCNTGNGAAAHGYTMSDIGGTNLRYGRVAMSNAFGPELLDLDVPMTVQYFADSDSGFLLHADDSCTTPVTLTLTDADPSDGLDVAAGETCVWDDGGVSGALTCPPPGPAAEQYALPPAGGRFNLWLRGPGDGNQGSVDVSATPPAWLLYDWGGGVETGPTARATFGIYRGRQGVIYRRELY